MPFPTRKGTASGSGAQPGVPAAKKPTKPAGQGRAPRAKPRSAKPPRALEPPSTTLQQDLLGLARDGAHLLRQTVVAVVFLAAIAGVAVGVWSIRPTPAYSSEGLITGSPFDLAFKVENESPWFELANLSISCIVDHIRASGLPPTRVEAKDVRFPARNVATLQPGESATFTCPFRALIGHPINDDPDIVRRSEIYFHAEYDVPFLRSFRLTHNSAHFFFDTRPIPPRWVVTQP